MPYGPQSGADLRFISPQPDTSLHCQTTDVGLVHRAVLVYVPDFAGTHCAYPRKDGQAEMTWVVGYIPRWYTRLQTVTHPSTNRTRR